MCCSFCTDICCCVKTGSYQKLVFGSGIRVTVESSKFYLLYAWTQSGICKVSKAKPSLYRQWNREHIGLCKRWWNVHLSLFELSDVELICTHIKCVISNTVWVRLPPEDGKLCLGQEPHWSSAAVSVWKSEMIKAKSRNWQNILSKEI